jgi:MFS transporter, OFA family, oxalate/formate antiporter
MFVFTATGGLIATAQLTPIAKSFGVADTQVVLVGITLLALPFALSMNRVLNGVSRPFFGWVSDHIGRERTMFIAFVLEGISFLLLSRFGGNPTAFVLLTALMFFAYGQIYSLFPAAAADSYGRKFASANAGLLYTAKGVASLVVPVTSIIGASVGGWRTVLLVSAAMNLVAAAMALVALKPLRSRLGPASPANGAPIGT